MLERQKTGNKSSELTHGSILSLFSAEVASQLEMASTGRPSRVSRSSLSVKLNNRDLLRAKLFKEFPMDLSSNPIKAITMRWAATKLEITSLLEWLWVVSSRTKVYKWLELKIVMSSCIIMRGKIASETSTRGSSRIRDEPSSSSSSCNNKVVQQHKGRIVLPLDPKEAQTQSTILSANSSSSNNRGTPTTETSARAFHKASKKQ